MAYFFAALVVGICAEIIAYTLKFWLYRKPFFPLLNIAVMFGLVMGLLLASRIDTYGWLLVAMVGFVIGYLYPIANFRMLKWWDFPGDTFLFFRGEQACAIGVAQLWAATPVLSWIIVKTLF